MHVVSTDHKVQVYGMDRMVITNWDGTGVHAVAQREGHGWVVTLPDEPEFSEEAGDRTSALNVMIAEVLERNPETSFTTWEPEVDIAGTKYQLRQLP